MIYFLIFIAVVVWVFLTIKKEKVAGEKAHDAIMGKMALADKKRKFSCPKCDKSTYIRDVACSHCSKPLKYDWQEMPMIPSAEQLLRIKCKTCNLETIISCPHCKCLITYSRVEGVYEVS